MKKVGILSMQRIANYGSFLQAYALKKIVEELGFEVQFVDYHPGKTLIHCDGGTGIKRKLTKVWEILRYSAPLKEIIKFIQYKKNYARNYYPYLDIDEMNYTPKLDVLIIGSDEVFNCVQSNSNVGFSGELFGQGNQANHVITYAASFGNTTIDKLEKYGVKDKVSCWLNDIDSLSVRDENSQKIVKELTGKDCEYNLDPVLIYDFIDKCKTIPSNIVEDPYMILYGYAGRFSKEECNKIKKYARSKGLKIFCIGGVQDVCDCFIDCDPFQVIAYFMNAECIITDTFHGTILSVITHKPFVSIIRRSGYGNLEKCSDLLNRLKLNNRVIDSMDELENQLEEAIDYQKIDEIIQMERKKTIKYLKENLRQR